MAVVSYRKKIVFSEEDRLSTFATWREAVVDKRKLSFAGFIYAQKRDNVECVECGLILNSASNQFQNPIKTHRIIRPGCPFIKRIFGNDLYGFKERLDSFRDKHERFAHTPTEYASAGFYCNDNEDEVLCFACGLTLSNWKRVENPIKKHTILKPGCPFINHICRENLCGYKGRLDSFGDKGGRFVHTPSEFASAGFYCNNKHDEVVCLSCGLILSDWKPGDDPWINHKTCAPHCPFLNVESIHYIEDEENTILAREQFKRVVTTSHEGKDIDIQERRYFSFVPWKRGVDKMKLSFAGFTYIQEISAVMCTECELIIRNQEPRLDPIKTHRIVSPNCPFIKRLFGDNLCSFIERLDSFKDGFVHTPSEFASAGFYYNKQDEVVCFSCDLILGNWKVEYDPIVCHKLCSPDCPFLNTETIRDKHIVRTTRKTLDSPSIKSSSIPSGGLRDTLASRLDTFKEWPKQVNQKPYELAKAGFYYTGESDRVCCFSCGSYFAGWSPEDDPWIEHAKWSQSCQFLKKSNNRKDNSEKRDGLGIRWLSSNLTSILDSEQAQVALSIGLTADKVKAAIERKLEETGEGFSSAECLIDVVLNIQNDEEGAGVAEDKTKSNRIDPIEEKYYTALHLEEENRRLKDDKLCKICMDAEVGIVLVPCGHLTSCVDCAINLTECPLCRSEITTTIRTYLT